MHTEHDAPRADLSATPSAPLTESATSPVDWGNTFLAGLNAIANLAEQCRKTTLDTQQQQYVMGILSAVDSLKLYLDSAVNGAEAPADQQEADTARQGFLLGNATVLLVEDSEINQQIVCELLKMAQVNVDVASDGQEAVDAVGRAPYALVLMDVHLPVLDGLEATRRIRAQGHTMPIIAMTGNTALEDKKESLAAGMNDHLTKPIAPEALFNVLAHWLPHTVRAWATVPGQPVILPQEIPGFNLVAGLAAVGNNRRLYADLLEKFATRYANTTEEITACLQNNDLKTAIHLAHTIKGLAANLGAEALADAARSLEKAITTSPGMITPHLKQLVLRLSEAIAAIRATLGDSAPERAVTPNITIRTALPAADAHALCAELEKALRHMESNWNAASDVARKVQERLHGTRLEGTAFMLVQAVEDFSTCKAQDLGRTLQEALNSAYTPQPLQRSQTSEGSMPSST